MKKSIFGVVGIFSVFALLAQSVFAAWDKPCDKRQILKLTGAMHVKMLESLPNVLK